MFIGFVVALVVVVVVHTAITHLTMNQSICLLHFHADCFHYQIKRLNYVQGVNVTGLY